MQLFFAFTLLVSAMMIFVVEPMFAKMVLPLLGGAPAVWNTCMVFYQAALLAGYLYAHLGAKYLGPRRQAMLHLALLAVGLIVLPVAIPRGWTPPGGENPIPWLLMVLSLSLGLPFLFLSASAPMIQSWFSHTGHRSARDPYFLYAASNVGSMLGLLGYPLVIEPLLTLRQQSLVWTGSYLLLILLTGGCAWTLWRNRRGPALDPCGAEPAPSPDAPPAAAPAGAEHEAGAISDRPVTWLRRLRWVALALVPSSLLLGVTTYMSIDVASFPLLWAIPLALYLLTFVQVFARRHLVSHSLMVHLQPALIVLLAACYFLGGHNSSQIVPLFVLSLAAFYVTAMVCHGELAKDRPPARHLTEFYLWMSLGGVLGGLFNALVAPLVFIEVLEFPLMLAAAGLVRPSWSFGSSLERMGLPQSALITTRRVRLGLLGLIPALLTLGAVASLYGLRGSLGGFWSLFWSLPIAIYLGSFAVLLIPGPKLPRWPLALLQASLVAMLVVTWTLVGGTGSALAAAKAKPAAVVLGLEMLVLAATALLCHHELKNETPHWFKRVTLLLWPATLVVTGLAWYGLARLAKIDWLAAEVTVKGKTSLAGLLPGLWEIVRQIPDGWVGMMVLLVGAGLLVRRSWPAVQTPVRVAELVIVLAVPLLVGVAAALRSATVTADYLDKNLTGVLPLLGQTPSKLATTLREASWSKLTGWVEAVLVLAGIAALLVQRRAVLMGIGMLGVLLVGHFASQTELGPVHIQRSFFGVLRVREDPYYDAYKLLHGSTSHGMQSKDVDKRLEPWTYYHRRGPVGKIFSALGHRFVEIGVVGLGTGTMASYGQPDQFVTFFEIDPVVESIARNTKYFHYLSDCRGKAEVVLGDARVQLGLIQRDFDILLIDAFSSDAIPTHLITREAIELYFRKLAPRGVLAVHISNRHLDLEPVIGNLAKALNLVARVCDDGDGDDSDEDDKGRFASSWIVVARNRSDLGPLLFSADWAEVKTDKNTPWTDDFSNVLQVLKWEFNKKWLDPRNWVR